MGLSELSSVFVTKQKDPEKLAQIYDFLSFSLKEENLRKYTVETGVIRPYVYNLTAEDRANMTYFARNNWDLFKDSENIALVQSSIIEMQPVKYATTGLRELPIKVGKVDYGTFVDALDRGSVTEIANGIAGAYSATDWAGFVNAARAAGFYK